MHKSEQGWRVSRDNQRVISTQYEMLLPSEHPPPINKTILIYTIYGTLLKGKWDDRDCLQWLPLPKPKHV